MKIIQRIRYLLNRSILNKLVISFIVIILIPNLIISYYSYNRLVQSTKAAYSRDNIEILKTIDKNLQVYFEDFERLTYNAFLSKDIQAILSGGNGDEVSKFENQQIFDDFVTNLIGDRSDIEGVYLICRNKYVYFKATVGDVKFNYDITGEPWFSEIEKSNGQFVIAGSHNQEYKGNITLRYVISAARKIKDLSSGTTIGFFLIEIKPDVFYKIFKDINMDDRHIIIADKKGSLVFEQTVFDQNAINYIIRKGDTVEKIADKYKIPVNKLITVNGINKNDTLKPGQSIIISGSDVKFTDIYPGINLSKVKNEVMNGEDGKKYFITKHISPQLSWTFIEIVPVSILLKQINEITVPTVLVSFLCFAVFVAAAFIISRNIAYPIKMLEDSMKKVQKGDFKQKVELNCGGEVESLASNFNVMVEKIMELIHTVYETRLKKLSSDFKALQAQINPHFLYNTLESVNCLAQLKGADDISEMIQGLAKMFRYSIKNDNEFVTLEDELNNVKNYILLQAVRYEDKFEILYDIPEKFLKCKAIKLILQPLVENAIYHGVEKVSRKGVIKIGADIKDNKLIINISDNGKGIGHMQLVEINRLLENDCEEIAEAYNSSSIGIFNIHSRIRLYMGKEYGLNIQSRIYEGTTIAIILPVKEEGGLHV